MIGYVKGTLADIGEDSVTIDWNGMGIQIQLGAGFLCELPRIGSEIKIFTYTHVREDAFLLYGFRSKDELELFKKLIGVSGIGPKGGLALLSVLSAEDLRFAIYAGDAKTIAKAPGIGKKTAERLVLELKDRISIDDTLGYDKDELPQEMVAAASDESRRNRKDAIAALTALGYSSAEAAKAVKNVNPAEDMDVEDILKSALKFLL